MRSKKSIPVNRFGTESGLGIDIEKWSLDRMPESEDWRQPERHDRHSFFLVEQGTVSMEIDFQKYEIVAPSLIYMHPDQVHLMLGFENLAVSSWALTNERLKPEYLQLLEEITPAKPFVLTPDSFALISDAINLALKIQEQHPGVLEENANLLVGLLIAQYERSSQTLNRFETLNKSFRRLLEQNYTQVKRPAEYAGKLNVSVAYLNECVKIATGFSVSHQIQQRVILQAKRLLCHSGQSVKEIAAGLGYDDYPYFSRLFSKVMGTTPLAFRNKNRD